MTEDQSRSTLELLVKVSREVATALDLRTVLQRVLYACIQYVGGERGSVVVMDDLGKPVDATIVYGKQFHDHTTKQLRDTVERGLAGWVIQNRKAALVPDTSRDERWLRRTLTTGTTHFWSRSRQTLWRKGETSGHVQHVDAVYTDCDRDTLLVLVHQDGVACHTGAPGRASTRVSPGAPAT